MQMETKILIVEDNVFAAENLKEDLVETGYQVTGIASNRSEVLAALAKEQPDLIIMDIELDNGESGVEIVKELNKSHVLPVLFLTGRTDQSTVKSAIRTNPATYLVKPYNIDELLINIDLALRKRQPAEEERPSDKIITDAIFIPHEQMHHKIKKDDIYAVEADGSYVQIHTVKKTWYLSSNLKNFIQQFSDPRFIRVSRKNLVNTSHITKINGNTLYVGPLEITISQEQRQHILNQFPILKTKSQSKG